MSILLKGCGRPVYGSVSSSSSSSSSSAPTTYLLDETGLGDSFAAYSRARKLRSAYGGSAFLVRRSSDDATLAIGFDGTENVDAPTLAPFCAGTDGYIVTEYDQSGNGRDRTQSLAGKQPKIVSSGSIITGANGKPCGRYDGVDDFMQWNGSFGRPSTNLGVMTPRSYNDTDRWWDAGSGFPDNNVTYHTANVWRLYAGGTKFSAALFTGVWKSVVTRINSSQTSCFQNETRWNATRQVDYGSVNGFTEGARATGNYNFPGDSSEHIVWNSSKSDADILTATTNQAAFYAHFTPA